MTDTTAAVAEAHLAGVKHVMDVCAVGRADEATRASLGLPRRPVDPEARYDGPIPAEAYPFSWAKWGASVAGRMQLYIDAGLSRDAIGHEARRVVLARREAIERLAQVQRDLADVTQALASLDRAERIALAAVHGDKP